MTPIEVTAIIGAITGIISLSVIVYKMLKEKPNLSICVDKAYYYPPYDDNYNFHSIQIGLIVNNTGDKATTIHTAKLTFIFNGKQFSPDKYDRTLHISPNSSESIGIQFQIRKQVFSADSDIINANLKLIHTYKIESIQIPRIKKFK